MLAKLKEKLRGKLKSESANDSASSTQTHFIAAFDPESGDIVISSPTRRDLVIASDSDAYEVSHKITCNNENSTFDSDNEVPGCDQSSDPFVEVSYCICSVSNQPCER